MIKYPSSYFSRQKFQKGYAITDEELGAEAEIHDAMSEFDVVLISLERNHPRDSVRLGPGTTQLLSTSWGAVYCH